MKKLHLLAVSAAAVFTFGCSSNNDDNPPISCEEASLATMEAAFAFSNATDQNLEQLCNAYKDALAEQIDVCGDANGELMAIVESLGDCQLNTNAGVVSVTVGTLNKTFETNITVTQTGNIRKVVAYDDMTSDWISFEVAQGATGATALSNFKIHLISSDYVPLPVDEGGNWQSNITANNATNITGTFFGYVTSPTTGADLSLTSGVINVQL